MRNRDQSEYDGRVSRGENPNSPYMKQLKRSIDASQAKIDKYKSRGKTSSMISKVGSKSKTNLKKGTKGNIGK